MADGFDADLALKITVTDQESYDYAGSALTACKRAIRDVELTHEGAIHDAERRLAFLRNERKKDLAELLEVEDYLKQQMGDWVKAQKAQDLPVERAPGTSYRETWDVEVTDLYALVRWAAQDETAMRVEAYLGVNLKALRALARDRKEEGEIAPGVIATKKGSMSATGR